MHNLDREELLDYLEFTIDQCISVGSTYQNNKKKLKETIRDYEIYGAIVMN